MSFDVSKFNQAFKQASGFEPSTLSDVLRATTFLFVLIASIFVIIHWLSNAKDKKEPMQFILPRLFIVAAIIMAIVFVLFVN